jgi:mannose-1-phosphate guanylyltransferase
VDREVANRYGCLVENPTTHEVLHYAEKPEGFISDLISCGVYLFDCMVFGEIRKARELRREEYPFHDVMISVLFVFYIV